MPYLNITLMPDKQYLSEDKYKELQAELHFLKTEERKKIAENLEYAKSLGDLSENAEYHEARDKQADVEDRIKQLEDILKKAEIISNHHSNKVEVGSTLVVKKNGGSEDTISIVGSEEADMLAGKISHESPLGQALLGHEKGEEVTVITPKGETKYKIVDIK